MWDGISLTSITKHLLKEGDATTTEDDKLDNDYCETEFFYDDEVDDFCETVTVTDAEQTSEQFMIT